jgi:hypothetical protein
MCSQEYISGRLGVGGSNPLAPTKTFKWTPHPLAPNADRTGLRGKPASWQLGQAVPTIFFHSLWS